MKNEKAGKTRVCSVKIINQIVSVKVSSTNGVQRYCRKSNSHSRLKGESPSSIMFDQIHYQIYRHMQISPEKIQLYSKPKSRITDINPPSKKNKAWMLSLGAQVGQFRGQKIFHGEGLYKDAANVC